MGYSVIFVTEYELYFNLLPYKRLVSSRNVKLPLKGLNSAKLIIIAQQVKHLLKSLIELG